MTPQIPHIRRYFTVNPRLVPNPSGANPAPALFYGVELLTFGRVNS